MTESRLYKTSGRPKRRKRQRTEPSGSRRLLQSGGTDSPEPVSTPVFNGDALGYNLGQTTHCTGRAGPDVSSPPIGRDRRCSPPAHVVRMHGTSRL